MIAQHLELPYGHASRVDIKQNGVRFVLLYIFCKNDKQLCTNIRRSIKSYHLCATHSRKTKQISRRSSKGGHGNDAEIFVQV